MPTVQSVHTRELFATPVLAALADQLVAFSPLTRERGQRYAADGHVTSLAFTEQRVTAVVRGTELYETEWDWDDVDGWMPACSCPVDPYCKHAYAVACCILAEAQTQTGFADLRLRKLLPPHVMAQTPPSRGAVRTAGKSPKSAPLEKLRAARQLWQRQAALDQLLGRTPVAGVGPYHPVLSEILSEADPDLMCWRLAREIPHLANGWLPQPLVPYQDRPDLAARGAAREQAALARELVKWAQRQHATVPRSLRLVFSLVGTPDQHAAVRIEARLTTPRIADEPRSLTQLYQLRNEYRTNPQMFTSEQAAVLDWLVTNLSAADTYAPGPSPNSIAQLNGTALKSLLTRIATPHRGTAPIARWSSELDPELARRAGVTPGLPVRARADAARLVPTCVSRHGEVWVDLVFLWPDGYQRPLSEVLYLRDVDEGARQHPSFVLADGQVSLVIEEPPAPLFDRFRTAGGLPLPPADRASLIATLSAHLPHLRDAVAPHTRIYPVTCAIALDLRDDDWLQFRVFAHTGTSPWRPGTPVPQQVLVFENSPSEGWVRHSASTPTADLPAAYGAIRDDTADASATATPAPAVDVPIANQSVADAEVWIEAPDPTVVEPALAWLTTTAALAGTKAGPGGRRPTWPDRTVGWWTHASPRRMAALADAWEQRPAGVAFFGTDRIRRLFSGQQRITPRVRIVSSGVDWFAIAAEWEAEGLQLSDADLAKLRNATSRFVKLPSGWVNRDVAAVHEETMEILADLGVDPNEGEHRLTLWQLVGAKPESLAALERMGADAEAVHAVAALRARVADFSGLKYIAPPAGLTATLRPYQQQGLDFLVHAASLGIGAVLADDMGLGKTVQALAWLEHLRATDPDGGPSLVVCPASVVHNWAREAAQFVPALRVLLLTSGSNRHALRQQIPQHDLIVTNYALLRRDLESWREIELRAAILDEAQNIKNPNAAVTKAALELRARHRLALTGTPLENRALDLWSILNFVNRGYLGNRLQFSNRFDRLDAPPHARSLLAAKLRPVLLRRMKREVATDLPERIEERQDCELTAGQRQLYLAELRRSRTLVEELSDAPDGVTRNQITILAALTRLRQICCHPALVHGKASLGSGKFEALFELLEPLLAEGHKVLVFSQFVECLKLISEAMQLRSIPHHMLTGQSVKREQIVDEFQADPDPCVFLISLKAGGTGLNLTSASYVVLFDPWWNPAVEAQAIDRTHRIGQDRTVIAYRLLTLGTIEEKIWELQQHKAALARDLLGEDGFARTLTRTDLDYLLADV